jgi:hypothetical protein
MLGTMLFPPADTRRTTLSLLAWWETRRATYNIAVGSAGVVTLVVTHLISWIPPGIPGIPFDWRPIVAYGVLANICFTFGWSIEAVAQRLWGDKCPRFGPALFRQGLAFSVGLTLLPILIVSIGWVAKVVSVLVGR